ncbi:Lipolytic protein family [Elusimicrobium minutum Pei191]|uniref:Lipolytic protein family n=1 Tax=Elusimicrobium minutum (strain Pei191) TaxID=445932 RepID=B2KBC9_ELUMP|nr:GDSL-type esterase/lipase family protein [Elusimicrobium minutum]ACC97951.1 Lipolytic protein family [Elusimicrobium minutum Pei191]
MKKVILTAIIAAAMVFAYKSFTKTEIKNLQNNNSNTIVAFGDSLTYGHGASPGKSYPDILAQKTNMRVVNLGVSGETAPQGLARINDVFKHRPYMVLIEFGGNDFIRKTPFEETVSAIEKMVDAVQAQGAVAVIVDTGGNPFMGKYTKAYKQIAKEKGAVFVPAIMDGILTNPKLKSDQIHPNNEGYAVLAERVYKGIKKYLNR